MKWVSIYGNAQSKVTPHPAKYAKDVTLRYPIYIPFKGENAVEIAKAISPKAIMDNVLRLKNDEAVAVAPTVTPRNIVIMFISSF